MEEQKNENLPEEVQAENSTEEDNGEQEKASGRRMLLWGLAGIYLLYTGFSLCKGFINGEEGSQMGFMIAGIAFLAIGAGLIFVAVRNALKSGKVKELKEAGEAAGRAGTEAAAGGELKSEDRPLTDRSMSIAHENSDCIAETIFLCAGYFDDVSDLLFFCTVRRSFR